MANPKVRDLRDSITLCQLSQESVEDSYGNYNNVTTYVPICPPVYAQLRQVKSKQLIGSAQIDQSVGNVTHTAIIRWEDAVDIFDTVTRIQRMPDGTLRTEYFRVSGTSDLDGNLRFMCIDLNEIVEIS